MEGETVIYNGRVVTKQGFRVFIYGFDGEEKLVESWDEYVSHISSGLWFASKKRPDLDKSPDLDNRKDKKKGRE